MARGGRACARTHPSIVAGARGACGDGPDPAEESAMRVRCFGSFVAAAALSLPTAAARADGDYLSPTEDRVRVSLGIQQVGATTAFEYDNANGTPGSLIDGENLLGLERRRIEPKFEVEVRAG